MNTKELVCNALRRWIRQRPGLEFGNYGDVKAYRSELRSITKDKREAETLLLAVANRSSISAKDLEYAACNSYAGRLLIILKNGTCSIDYTTGQYWPTEYRRAACAVLASALWNNARPDYATGDELRAYFKREFGKSISKRWLS